MKKLQRSLSLIKEKLRVTSEKKDSKENLKNSRKSLLRKSLRILRRSGKSSVKIDEKNEEKRTKRYTLFFKPSVDTDIGLAKDGRQQMNFSRKSIAVLQSSEKEKKTREESNKERTEKVCSTINSETKLSDASIDSSRFKFGNAKFGREQQERLEKMERKLKEARKSLEQCKISQEPAKGCEDDAYNLYIDDAYDPFEERKYDHLLACLDKTIVNLSHKKLTKEEVAKICRALKDNTKVIELDLSGNGLGCECAYYISDMLRVNKTLKILNLHNNFVRDEGVFVILNAFETNFTITEILVDEGLVCEDYQEMLEICLNRNRKSSK